MDWRISLNSTSTRRLFNVLCCHMLKEFSRPKRVVSEPTTCFSSSRCIEWKKIDNIRSFAKKLASLMDTFSGSYRPRVWITQFWQPFVFEVLCPRHVSFPVSSVYHLAKLYFCEPKTNHDFSKNSLTRCSERKKTHMITNSKFSILSTSMTFLAAWMIRLLAAWLTHGAPATHANQVKRRPWQMSSINEHMRWACGS